MVEYSLDDVPTLKKVGGYRSIEWKSHPASGTVSRIHRCPLADRSQSRSPCGTWSE